MWGCDRSAGASYMGVYLNREIHNQWVDGLFKSMSFLKRGSLPAAWEVPIQYTPIYYYYYYARNRGRLGRWYLAHLGEIFESSGSVGERSEVKRGNQQIHQKDARHVEGQGLIL